MKQTVLARLLGLVLLTLPLTALAGQASPSNPEDNHPTLLADNHDHGPDHDHDVDHADDELDGQDADDHGDAHADDHGHHATPALWSVIPFILLLGMIATGPLFYPTFWHHYYPHIAAALGALVVTYYLAVLGDAGHPVHSFFEYFSFIALLTPLFVASGGILIDVDKEGTPWVNIALLVFGAFIANIIGTTGASMLLIRPFIRLNKGRIQPYHIVFFIFMVSNVGGCLTPIGDPPLFLGFLKGIPFEWTIIHSWPYWLLGISLLSVIFYFFDRRNQVQDEREHTGTITVRGLKNLLFLGITIGAVFLDPNVVDMPRFLYIEYHGDKFSYLREIIMLGAAAAAYFSADKSIHTENEFNFEPIREVAFLFIGIFATMMPALQLISTWAGSESGAALISANSLYWMTGGLSGVLDNAPTYLNFLSAGMGKVGLDIGSKADVATFVAQTSQPGMDATGYLLAISIAAVFFGAGTYIGNAPNFMVKAIAEQAGIRMPAFVAYIIKYSVPILLPVLFVTWLAFLVIG